MRVLSLFNGISCGRLAFERAGINVSKYVSYEIDKTANNVSRKHFPHDDYNGDVWTVDVISHILSFCKSLIIKEKDYVFKNK